jgi:hypothetical protein
MLRVYETLSKFIIYQLRVGFTSLFLKAALANPD